MIRSVAKVRETPYLTSSQVIGEPSSHFGPSLRVKDHEVASSLGVPVSVARSGVSSLAVFSSVQTLYDVRVRLR